SSPPFSTSEMPFEIPYPSPSITVYKKPTATKTPKNLISLTIPTEIPWNIAGLGKILHFSTDLDSYEPSSSPDFFD
ncbi:18189_t:CDS:2, partial [Racocetra persica]